MRHDMRTATMIGGMYMITFTMFVIETGSPYKAATMGFVAAIVKSIYSLAHHSFWTGR